MRAFQQLVAFFFALFAFAYAQSEEASYDATVYVTSTVYRVSSVTLPGTPTGYVHNSTSTFHSTLAATATPVYSAGNGSSFTPTGTSGPQPTDFPGAASSLNVNAFVVALAAGVAYLAL
ncbi:uncharacterized protein EI97DRAFT_446514 [Westerdykella ornata]|uniref:Uncharacterized protein n=1 Tax=Westerdykella ornata TaxID=318751 RepID=A0A6A6J8L5_WESOR|nr:uncharacterized protein EI97DRAFT_446514 [Westerdykella ornata]KAF2271549.1 hypothetical protein EI97DRAFT_446514 [Westerdykella ornata]